MQRYDSPDSPIPVTTYRSSRALGLTVTDEGGLSGCPNEQDPEPRLGRETRRDEQRRHRSQQQCRNQAISTKPALL